MIVLYKLFRMGPNMYSFFSGVCISVSVNLFTSNLYPETITLADILPLISGVLFFISGVFGILIAWNLDEITKVAITEKPSVFNSLEGYELWKDFVDNKKTTLIPLLVLLVIFSVLGLFILTSPALKWVEAILLSLSKLGGK